jgi:hypothetical protein
MTSVDVQVCSSPHVSPISSKVYQWCDSNETVKLQMTTPNNHVYIIDARICLSARDLSRIMLQTTGAVELDHPQSESHLSILPQGTEIMLDMNVTADTWTGAAHSCWWYLIA